MAVAAPMAGPGAVETREVGAVVGARGVRQGFIEVAQRALSQGIFGAPIMVVQDEIYWGKDRFDFIREHLARLTE